MTCNFSQICDHICKLGIFPLYLYQLKGTHKAKISTLDKKLKHKVGHLCVIDHLCEWHHISPHSIWHQSQFWRVHWGKSPPKNEDTQLFRCLLERDHLTDSEKKLKKVPTSINNWLSYQIATMTYTFIWNFHTFHSSENRSYCLRINMSV